MITREQILAEHPDASEKRIQQTLDYYNDEFYKAKGSVRAAGQGLTFGFGDEMTAAIKHLFGKGSYDELVEEERAKLQLFRESNPALAYGMEIASGFLIPGAGLAKGAATAGKIALTASKAAKVGATQGALYGAGAGEGNVFDMAEGSMSRVGGAATGAALGGAMGGVLPKTFRGIASGAGWANKKLRGYADALFNGRVAAREGRELSKDQKLVAERLEKAFREQLELDDPTALRKLDNDGIPASAHYRSKVSKMGQHATLADLPGMESLVAGATQGYGGARNLARSAFTVRAEKEFDLLINEAEDVMRATHDSAAMINKVKEIALRRAAPLYDKGAREVDLKDFMGVLADPLTKSVYNSRRAWVAHQVRRKKLSPDNLMPNWKELGGLDKVSSKVMHHLKIGFGQKGKWAAAKVETTTAHYRGLQEEMSETLGELVPGYKQADRVYTIGQKVEEWAAMGAKALSKRTTTEVADEFNSLKGAIAQKAYRSGLLTEIGSKGGSLGKYLTDPRKIKVRRALEATFPDEKSFKNFIANAEKQRLFRETEDLAGLGGSRTARTDRDILAFDQRINPGDVIEEGVRVAAHPFGATKFLGQWIERTRGIQNARVASQVMSILLTGAGTASKKGHWKGVGAARKWVPETEGLRRFDTDVSGAFDRLLKTHKDISDRDRVLVRSIQSGLAALSGQTGGQAPHVEEKPGGFPGLLMQTLE